jgi:thioredoxin reductase (NADPH)
VKAFLEHVKTLHIEFKAVVTCDGLVYQGKKVAVLSDFEDGEGEVKALEEDHRCKVVRIPAERVLKLRAIGGKVEILHKEGKSQVDGVFIIRKGISPASILRGLKIKEGYVSVDSRMETNIRGVFAAGDCTGPPFQIAKAVGQGQVAALSAANYLRGS